MNRIDKAMKELHIIDRMSKTDTLLKRIHPSVKIVTTIFYIAILMSFKGEDFVGILTMSFLPILWFCLGEIPVVQALNQLKMLFGLLFFIGILNPFFDTRIFITVGQIPITFGMVTCITLFLKGGLALLASYSLMVSTGMEEICYGLQVLHVPSTMITVTLLIYRYLILFLKEVNRISIAYSMRAPGKKGIHKEAWGSLVGSMLIRSMNRGETLYESMMLRGFRGKFYLQGTRKGSFMMNFLYLVGMMLLLMLLRGLF